MGWTWSKIVWQFFLKNEIALEQKAEWTWISSCHYIWSFGKACSFDFFKESAYFVIAQENMLFSLVAY